MLRRSDALTSLEKLPELCKACAVPFVAHSRQNYFVEPTSYLALMTSLAIARVGPSLHSFCVFHCNNFRGATLHNNQSSPRDSEAINSTFIY